MPGIHPSGPQLNNVSTRVSSSASVKSPEVVGQATGPSASVAAATDSFGSGPSAGSWRAVDASGGAPAQSPRAARLNQMTTGELVEQFQDESARRAVPAGQGGRPDTGGLVEAFLNRSDEAKFRETRAQLEADPVGRAIEDAFVVSVRDELMKQGWRPGEPIDLFPWETKRDWQW